jgi:probable phosphomutase (TIGR03848 family)
VLLIRHGRSTANTCGLLAGWTPGIHLDEAGRGQVAELGSRLKGVPLAELVCSPLERCRETAEGALAAHPTIDVTVDERLGECRYGSWTGRPLAELVAEPLWSAVQVHPSSVTFPGDDAESMAMMQFRAVAAIREHDARVAQTHGPSALWAVVSHGDVIKAVLADALGMHLDLFQRISVDPASVSVVRYTALRPFVLRLNDSGGGMTDLIPRGDQAGSSEAVVGGGAGAEANHTPERADRDIGPTQSGHPGQV